MIEIHQRPRIAGSAAKLAEAKNKFVQESLIAHLGRTPEPKEIIQHGHCFIMHDGIQCYTWDDHCFATYMPMSLKNPFPICKATPTMQH